MLSRVCASLLLVGVAGVGGVAFGQSLQTVPPAFDAVAGSDINSLPIGNYSSGTHQVIYGADQLAGIPVGSVITGMQLRLAKGNSVTFPTGALTITRYDIKLATSTLTPATMSSTFASNMSNPVQVRSGTFGLAAGAYQWLNNGAGVPEPWGPVIPFTTGYPYAGGPLVIEMRVVSPSSTFNAYADIANTAAARYMYSDNDPDAATATSFGPGNGGLVVRLTFIPPTVDLAKGVTKVIVGENFAGANGGAGDGVLAWTSQYSQQAVASSNQFDTIGPGSDFVGMAWRLNGGDLSGWPTAIANFGQYDVQLSHSVNAPGALSNTVATNVGADAVQVRSGALSFGIGVFAPRGAEVVSPFGPEVSFANSYQYRNGPLLSVIRHSGQGSGTPGYFDGIGFGGSPDVQAKQTPTAAAVTIGNQSSYLTTRFSVDAGTISPLNQLAPTPGDLGLVISPLYQTILSASELKYIPVGSVIDSLWLRQAPASAAGPTSNVTALDFELTVSSATVQPEFMSTTAAANEGADKVLVHDGSLVVAAGTMPAGSNGNFGKIVQFQKQFVYKGGPLCVTIRHTGLTSLLGSPEAVKGTTATNRSIYDFSVGAPAGSFLSGGYTGTAMKLGYIPSVMTPNNLATAEGVNGINLLTSGNPFVAQVIVAADQLRTVDVGSAITGMSFRESGSGSSNTFPATDTTMTRFDVTLAPAANGPLSASNTYASNNGPGVVTVRTGSMLVPANAFPYSGSPTVPGQNAWYVPFSRAYVYTGGDLCVTIRSEGALAPSSFMDVDGASPNIRGVTKYGSGDANAATAGSTFGPLAIRFAFTPRAFCPWDLNNDGVVEDADFTIFLSAYNMLDCADPSMPQGCPADFNYDRVVDDADFSLFVVAYNALLCP